jgi:hypothetical protein
LSFRGIKRPDGDYDISVLGHFAFQYSVANVTQFIVLEGERQSFTHYYLGPPGHTDNVTGLFVPLRFNPLFACLSLLRIEGTSAQTGTFVYPTADGSDSPIEMVVDHKQNKFSIQMTPRFFELLEAAFKSPWPKPDQQSSTVSLPPQSY